jgi:hypothetical protein
LPIVWLLIEVLRRWPMEPPPRIKKGTWKGFATLRGLKEVMFVR